MIWSVKHLGDFEKEEALFTTARLEDHKGQASCFSINIEAPVSGEALESAVKDLQAKIMEHAMAGEAPPPELLEQMKVAKQRLEDFQQGGGQEVKAPPDHCRVSSELAS